MKQLSSTWSLGVSHFAIKYTHGAIDLPDVPSLWWLLLLVLLHSCCKRNSSYRCTLFLLHLPCQLRRCHGDDRKSTNGNDFSALVLSSMHSVDDSHGNHGDPSNIFSRAWLVIAVWAALTPFLHVRGRWLSLPTRRQAESALLCLSWWSDERSLGVISTCEGLNRGERADILRYQTSTGVITPSELFAGCAGPF